MNAGTYLAASRYAMPYHARPREMECIDYLRAYLTLHELLPFKLTPRNILRNCGVINMLLNRSYLSSPKISSLFARYLRISVECCIIFSIYYLRLFILQMKEGLDSIESKSPKLRESLRVLRLIALLFHTMRHLHLHEFNTYQYLFNKLHSQLDILCVLRRIFDLNFLY